MITIKDFFDKISDVDKDGTMRLTEIKLRVGKYDGIAGRVLSFLNEIMEPDATVGEYAEVLNGALFWLTFVYSTGEKVSEEQETA